jgi:hypothetical protein
MDQLPQLGFRKLIYIFSQPSFAGIIGSSSSHGAIPANVLQMLQMRNFYWNLY